MDMCHTRNAYPYILMLHGLITHNTNPDTTNLRCISSYVAINWAVTPASCYINSTYIYVLVGGDQTHGSLFFASDQQRRFVSDWIVHPKFDPEIDLLNNIALLKLETSFNLNFKVNAIKMYSYKELNGCDISFLFISCSLVHQQMQGGETMVTKTIVTNILHKTCDLQVNSSVPRSLLCTVSYTSSTCDEKVGSPLVCNRKLAGLLLTAIQAEGNCTSVFVRVDVYSGWFLRYVPIGLWYDENVLIVCEGNRAVLKKGGAGRLERVVYMIVFSPCVVYLVFVMWSRS